MVNNDVLYEEVLFGLSGSIASVFPAQIKIEKARIMAQIEIKKKGKNWRQNNNQRIKYNTASSGEWKTKFWSNKAGKVSPKIRGAGSWPLF